MDRKTEEQRNRWMVTLAPKYGEREADNLWRWYLEADRPFDLFEDDLHKLSTFYPIQYLTGYAYFYGEKFIVNQHTLIPRPETEELVYQVLEDHPPHSNRRVIDLGTGTGCIPITLKKHRSHWFVTGLDLFPQTLKVAKQNAEVHQVSIHWQIGDILNLDSGDLASYDIIISNPPYIRPDEGLELDENVYRFEPHEALFTSDSDGLEFYRAIARHGQQMRSGAHIYLEIHPHSADQISDLFSDTNHFQNVEILQDMQGRNRIMKANVV